MTATGRLSNWGCVSETHSTASFESFGLQWLTRRIGAFAPIRSFANVVAKEVDAGNGNFGLVRPGPGERFTYAAPHSVAEASRASRRPPHIIHRFLAGGTTSSI